MCDEDVDDCLPALKLAPNWFVSSKILEKLHDALFANDLILIFHEAFGKVTSFSSKIGFLSVDLDKINLDDVSFDKDDPELLFISDFWSSLINLKNVKHLKTIQAKTLMPVTWHPTRWWDWCLAEEQKKEVASIFTDRGGK